jgi:hypothetical protein
VEHASDLECADLAYHADANRVCCGEGGEWQCVAHGEKCCGTYELAIWKMLWDKRIEPFFKVKLRVRTYA